MPLIFYEYSDAFPNCLDTKDPEEIKKLLNIYHLQYGTSIVVTESWKNYK